MICELQIKFFFCPFGILWYKFLSYIEVLCVLSEFSKLLELSELIELPEVFCSMKKCLFHGALRLGDPLIKLLELRFVSSSSETSRSSGTIQTSQNSISSHPVFPDVTSSKVRIGCKLGKSASSVHTLQWSNHGVFNSLYLISNKVKDGTSDWLQTVLNHQSQLPKELLHGSLCPILLNMAGPKKLVLANLEGLT